MGVANLTLMLQLADYDADVNFRDGSKRFYAFLGVQRMNTGNETIYLGLRNQKLFCKLISILLKERLVFVGRRLIPDEVGIEWYISIPVHAIPVLYVAQFVHQGMPEPIYAIITKG